jgi:hypothetical protein
MIASSAIAVSRRAAQAYDRPNSPAPGGALCILSAPRPASRCLERRPAFEFGTLSSVA